MEVYLADFPGMKNLRRVSAEGGSCPRWRRDGQELFYIADDELLSVSLVNLSGSESDRGMRPKSLFPTVLANATRSPLYATSASDGSRFLLVERDSSISESDDGDSPAQLAKSSFGLADLDLHRSNGPKAKVCYQRF